MPTDPLFYLAASVAVILVGLSKGGLGGAMAILGVPIMATVVPPVQAAAILLPILLVMDAVSLWTWRKDNDPPTIWIVLPAATAGIAIGWLTAIVVPGDAIRLVVGLIALVFSMHYAWNRYIAGKRQIIPRPHNRIKGTFWGVVAGFTSFVSHAGGPPYQVYTLPLGQDPKTFTGTSVRVFAAINAIKLIPYFALGQFDATNLKLSLVLIPLAPIATLIGAGIVKRIKAETFYPFMYSMVFLTSLKLIYDGLASLGF